MVRRGNYWYTAEGKN